MSEFLQDLRDHWNDSYWWADHQLLLAVLLGIVSLGFHALKLWMDHRWATLSGGES